MNRVSRWRVCAAVAILGILAFILADFAPYYVRNLKLQNFVSAVTRSGQIATQSDDVLRTWVVEKAHQLQLPVADGNVHITHTPEGTHIDVRYFVRVNLPGYTVDLHFYPGAGSR